MHLNVPLEPGTASMVTSQLAFIPPSAITGGPSMDTEKFSIPAVDRLPHKSLALMKNSHTFSDLPSCIPGPEATVRSTAARPASTCT